MNRPFGNLPHEPCCLLRWKAMFISVEPDPTVPHSNDQIYWCSQTQVCVGPDGKVAAPASCRAGRSCYSDVV
jgi:hypothetical protein